MEPERTPRWAMRTIVGLIALAVIAALVVAVYPSIPGTFWRDVGGVAHGTGRCVYRYRSGQVKLVEDYRRGKQARSEWYRPDGTVVATTDWVEGSGVGYYLREDGSIRNRMTYVRGIAEGPATYYDETGNTVGEAVFKDGSRISGYQPPPAQ